MIFLQNIRYSLPNLPKTIPDLGSLQLSAEVDELSSLLVDWVVVEVDIDHLHASDLEVTLTSPMGTQSALHTAFDTETAPPEVC